MTIQWAVFLPGALLLLIPADQLLSARVELRSFDCFRRPGYARTFRPWWWVPALWLDPLRAFGGTFLLHHSLAVNAYDWPRMSKPDYALMLGIVTLGVILQTFTRRADEGVLLAPIGFVSGVLAALTPWPLALIGVASGFVGLFAFRQFHAYFGFGLVAIAVLGFVLDAPMMWVVPAVCVFALPVAAGIVSGCTLEIPVRDSVGAGGPPAIPPQP